MQKIRKKQVQILADIERLGWSRINREIFQKIKYRKYPLNGTYGILLPGKKVSIPVDLRQGRNFGGGILPGQQLKEEAMRKGAILIADGLFDRIPSFVQNVSTEIYFDAIMENCADSVILPEDCADAGQLLYFGLLNFGARVSLISKNLPNYIPARPKTYGHASACIKKGSIFITNGSILSFFNIGFSIPGDIIMPEPGRIYRADIKIIGRNRLTSIEILRNGNRVKEFRPLLRQKGGMFSASYEFRENETSWYVLKTADEKNGYSISNPIYFENPVRKEKFRFCIMSCLGNFTADGRFDRRFNLHFRCVVNRGLIGKLFLFKDGIPIKEIVPAVNTGQKAKKGPYYPYILSIPDSSPSYVEICYPLENTGSYHVQAETSAGTIASRPVLYDPSSCNSYQVSYLLAGESSCNVEIMGWCEGARLEESGRNGGMPAAYEKDSAWKIRANFEGVEHKLKKGTDLSSYFLY